MTKENVGIEDNHVEVTARSIVRLGIVVSRGPRAPKFKLPFRVGVVDQDLVQWVPQSSSLATFEKRVEVRLLVNNFNLGSMTFANLTIMGGKLRIDFF